MLQQLYRPCTAHALYTAAVAVDALGLCFWHTAAVGVHRCSQCGSFSKYILEFFL
jgi:hypothetical protein